MAYEHLVRAECMPVGQRVGGCEIHARWWFGQADPASLQPIRRLPSSAMTSGLRQPPGREPPPPWKPVGP